MATTGELAERPLRPFPPTPALDLLRDAAARLDAPSATALVEALDDDYPRSLERRPAQLVRASASTSADLDRLLRAAGFADLDDVRRQVAAQHGVRLAATELRLTYRPEYAEPDRTGLARILRREQENLAETIRVLRGSGALELAAGAIRGSRHRWVLGDLRSSGYAHRFAADLAGSLNAVTFIEPTGSAVTAALSDAHRRDSLTVFCFRRYSRLSVRVAEEFAALGAPVIAVTDADDSPICPHAAHVVRIATAGDPPPHSPTAVAAVIHALAAMAAAGAKGAARRTSRRHELAATMDWYERD